jgi:enoyl-[acyl-carrier protein] reductase III
MQDLFTLQGKRVLVAGGTRGIGRAISLRFAVAGASVIANYVRDQKAAEQLEEEAKRAGLSLEVCRADVTSSIGLEALLDRLGARFEKLSALVYCAATGVHRPLEQLTLRQFDWTFALDVRAFFELVRLLLPRFERGGNILAISSEGAVRAQPQYCLVGSAKAALESLVRHFAAELGPQGIRVNALAPGAVATDAWKVLPDAEARLSEVVRRTPLARLNSVDEVACAAQFLCSGAATGVNGHTLVVDGGHRIVG